mmetsp:Transcript_14393/g.29867  ORF Transcript_14393/g.29867 Transcript_14393/m.29867 type:complete len:577 (-) Transcript_14393:15-1745(-)
MAELGSSRAALQTSLSASSFGQPERCRCQGACCTRCHSRVFPCNVGLCCPCLPSSWRSAKDWLHLVLILGVLSSTVFVILQIVEIALQEHCHTPFCLGQLISAILLLPSLYDFFKFIGAYDESLQEHKQRAEDEVHGLIESINQQVAEMQDVAAKLTESATDFAFRSFDSSREGFEKFILDLKLYYSELYEDPLMLQELRCFMLKWLHVFSQSLLDAETNPLLKGIEEEFKKCETLDELCEKVTGRLSRLKVSTRLVLAPAESYVLSTAHQRPQLALEEGLPSASFATASSASTASAVSGGKCGVSWLRLDCRGRFGRQVLRTRDGNFDREWPLTIAFCCGSITILSRRHLNHLLYFLLDLVLVLYEVLDLSQAYSIALVCCNWLCVLSTLACFEQIDEIAQLQRRICRYRERSDRVQEQHREAKENWAKVQQLHDLWNYRTQPFLSICGKIHRALDNKDREDARALELARRRGEPPEVSEERRLEWLRRANQSLECLDQKLGRVQNWTKEGQAPLSKEWKESIGRQLREAERQEQVEQLIQVLPILTSDLRQIEDGSAPGSQLAPGSPVPRKSSS